MENPFVLLLVILFGGASTLAFFAAYTLLLPTPIARVQQKLEDSGGRSLLLGFVNFLFFGLLAVLLVWLAERLGGVLAAVVTLLAGLIALVMIALTVTGLVALSSLLGARMGKKATPFTNILRGGTLLLLAGLAPYVGWFVFTPLAAWAGLGAAIATFVPRREKEAKSEAAG
jgi:hypothetical protein